MYIQRYPRLVSVYKGEGRILIIPSVDHIGGYRVDSNRFSYMCKVDDALEIGNQILEAFKNIDESPESTLTREEIKELKALKNGTKYKTWLSFWKHNLQTGVALLENGEMRITAKKKSVKPRGGYMGGIKSFELKANPSAEEIGNAVLECFRISEEYHANLGNHVE